MTEDLRHTVGAVLLALLAVLAMAMAGTADYEDRTSGLGYSMLPEVSASEDD